MTGEDYLSPESGYTRPWTLGTGNGSGEVRSGTGVGFVLYVAGTPGPSRGSRWVTVTYGSCTVVVVVGGMPVSIGGWSMFHEVSGVQYLLFCLPTVPLRRTGTSVSTFDHRRLKCGF